MRISNPLFAIFTQGHSRKGHSHHLNLQWMLHSESLGFRVSLISCPPAGGAFAVQVLRLVKRCLVKGCSVASVSDYSDLGFLRRPTQVLALLRLLGFDTETTETRGNFLFTLLTLVGARRDRKGGQGHLIEIKTGEVCPCP